MPQSSPSRVALLAFLLVLAAPARPQGRVIVRAFDGRGRVHGELVAGRGTTHPERWSLVLEGSPMLQGRERASYQRLEFEHGERAFDVPDLPLAGYRVRVEAEGLNGPPVDVLLVASSPAAFVTLTVTPSGFLDGQVRLADGAPAEGLRVTLESAATRARRAIDCDVNGRQGMWTCTESSASPSRPTSTVTRPLVSIPRRTSMRHVPGSRKRACARPAESACASNAPPLSDVPVTTAPGTFVW